jgi:hypothetical protein
MGNSALREIYLWELPFVFANKQSEDRIMRLNVEELGFCVISTHTRQLRFFEVIKENCPEAPI